MPNQLQTTQTNAVQTVKSLMQSDAVKTRLTEMLGKKAAGFISSVISVSNSPVLIGADPKTVMNAAVVAATLDLPINPNLGFAYIVPYVNKGVKQAQFQMGWKGVYQLAMRTDKYKRITTNEVYEGEVSIKNRFKEEYEFGEAKSDKVVGFLAYYEMHNGAEKYFYMTAEDMEKHAKKYSQSYRNDKYNTSQWTQNFIEMGKKTVLKLLLSKYGELSIEQQMAQKFDQAVVKDDISEVDNIEEVSIEYVDNQADESAQAQAPSSSIADAMAKASAEFSKSEKKEDTPTTELF